MRSGSRAMTTDLTSLRNSESLRQPIDDRLRDRLGEFVAHGSIRPADLADSIAGTMPSLIVAPGSESELASVLRFANEAGLAVIPRGGGTKLEWGNPPRRADLILSLERLNRVEEHAWADLTVTVEAGCTIRNLQQTLARHGQHLAIDPLLPEQATVGGVLSTNDTGAMRLCHGGLRDLVIGVTLALADGTLAKSGGKVVKNVAGYDLPKLVTGASGTLGVITRAVFRVHPLPQNPRTLSIRVKSLPEVQRVLLSLLGSNIAYSAIQVRAASGDSTAIDVALSATEAGLQSQEARVEQLGPGRIQAEPAEIWSARQALWQPEIGEARPPVAPSIVKISILPSEIEEAIAAVDRAARAHHAVWRAVIQGTGIGWLSLQAEANADPALPALLEELRAEFEKRGGSLVILRKPEGRERLDAWGTPSDALPLMRALKEQFDPKATLNPGRYLGGI